MSDDSKTRGLAGDQQSQQYYGTFQGVANYFPTVPPPPPEPVVGFPQPVPPPGSTGRPPLPPHHQHHHHHHHRGYQTVTGYAVVEGRPVQELRLPCCGMGIGWLLFIIGFFLGGIPWYVGTFILLCVRVDYREKPGYVACTIASILAVIAVTLGATKGARTWETCACTLHSFKGAVRWL